MNTDATTPASQLTLVPNVKFAKLNKNCDLARYQEEVASGDYDALTVHVAEVLFLDIDAFDAFADNLLDNDERIAGKGGCICVATSEVRGAVIDRDDPSKSWVRSCILVVAPGRPSMYVDPQGYDYARYVGI